MTGMALELLCLEVVNVLSAAQLGHNIPTMLVSCMTPTDCAHVCILGRTAWSQHANYAWNFGRPQPFAHRPASHLLFCVALSMPQVDYDMLDHAWTTAV